MGVSDTPFVIQCACSECVAMVKSCDYGQGRGACKRVGFGDEIETSMNQSITASSQVEETHRYLGSLLCQPP